MFSTWASSSALRCLLRFSVSSVSVVRLLATDVLPDLTASAYDLFDDIVGSVVWSVAMQQSNCTASFSEIKWLRILSYEHGVSEGHDVSYETRKQNPEVKLVMSGGKSA